MAIRIEKWSTFLVALGALGLAIFSKGFFPSKLIAPGFAEMTNPYAFGPISESAHFEKLIFVVVDAMRADFMFSEESQMHFLHSLVRENCAIPFTAYSHPPTVTLPRLKGITTGQIPSFVDAVLNVADDNDSSQGLTHTDSWVWQFMAQKGGRKINFFGDDTWLKLFPAEHFFNESEGTSSFFVNDFTEVDRNVSRHLDRQLAEGFDALILHYLGLDHIGHSGGPGSSHMADKQKEMDQVLRHLYQSDIGQSPSTLIVIMGDHGMNEVGNHGGSSSGETSPGLALISKRFGTLPSGESSPCPIKADNFEFYSNIDQVDLVPTLAALFNFPIPKNSVGIIIPQVLHLMTEEVSKKKMLLENCEQMIALLELQRLPRSRELLADMLELRQMDSRTVEDYYVFLHKVKAILVQNSTNYSLKTMFLGLGVTIIATGAILCTAFSISNDLMREFHSGLYRTILISYAALFHASSFIEEEHQFWWFFAVWFFGYSALYDTKRRSLLIFFCLRLLRSWSSLGQKNRDTTTLSQLLMKHDSILWPLVLLSTFTPPLIRLKSNMWKSSKAWLSSALELLMCTCTILLKLLQAEVDGRQIPTYISYITEFIFGSSNSLVSLQGRATYFSRVFYGLFCAALILRFTESRVQRTLSITLILSNILIHQARVEIIPIYLIFHILEGSLMQSLKGSSPNLNMSLILSTFILQNLSFFSTGNSNSIATIDLANAYNGLKSYSLPLVGTLTFVSNFGPPIYWTLAYYRILSGSGLSSKAYKRCKSERSIILSTFYLVSAVSLVSSCIAQRYHLFIWSVFCPKVLYFAAWLFLVYIGFDITLCRVVL